MCSRTGDRERVCSSWTRQSIPLAAIVTRLHLARTENLYDGLVLVAPPKLLGLLRSSLNGATTKWVVGSLDKDLAASEEKELAKHLGEVMAV